MATFLSYLGGISKGASQNLLARGQEDRARTERQNELQAQAIENAWKDPDFRADKTPEDFLNSMKQVHILRGGTKAEADQIYSALSHVHGVHEKLGAPAGSLNDAFGTAQKRTGVDTSTPPPAGGQSGLPDIPSNTTAGQDTGAVGDQAAPTTPTKSVTPAAAPGTPAQGLAAMPTAPSMGLPAFTAPYPDHEDGSELTYGERVANRTALAEHIKNNEEAQREAAKQDYMTKRETQKQLDLESGRRTDDERRHAQVIADQAAASSKGQHMKIEYINGQERLIPDVGTSDGKVYGGSIDDDPDLPDKYKDKVVIRRRFSDGKFEYAPVSDALTSVTNATDSPTGAWKTVYDKAGNFISKVPTQPNTSLLPTNRTATEYRTISTTDANGNPVTRLEPVTVNSTSQKQIPGQGGTSAPASGLPALPKAPGTASQGAPAQPTPTSATTVARGGGAKEFPKSLNPDQMMKLQANNNQIDLTINRAQAIHDQIDKVSGLLESKKLQIVAGTDGLLHALVSKGVKLSPEEADLVANVRQLREEINLLRGPEGATGFRSQSAYDALQALGTDLMGNPEVTKKNLEKTIQALTVQRDTQAHYLPKNQATPSTALPTPPASNKIRVIRLKDNTPGSISPENFDPKIYKRETP